MPTSVITGVQARELGMYAPMRKFREEATFECSGCRKRNRHSLHLKSEGIGPCDRCSEMRCHDHIGFPSIYGIDNCYICGKWWCPTCIARDSGGSLLDFRPDLHVCICDCHGDCLSCGKPHCELCYLPCDECEAQCCIACIKRVVVREEQDRDGLRFWYQYLCEECVAENAQSSDMHE